MTPIARFASWLELRRTTRVCYVCLTRVHVNAVVPYGMHATCSEAHANEMPALLAW